MGFKKIEFKDFITLQRGFDLPTKDRNKGEYPVVASTSITDYHNDFKVEPPGVTTGRSGSLGEVLYLKEKFWPLNTTLWVKDFKENNPKYVYYFLTTLNLEKYNSGAGVPTLNRNHLDSLEIRIHDLDGQEKIASILSAFDDLIENNTRRIEILEEMARLIYREWFVHFRFPGHEDVKMVDSELGEIPEGWEIKEVRDIVKRHSKKTVYRKKELSDQGNVIVIDQSTDEYAGFHNNDPDFNAKPDNPYIIFGDHTCRTELLIRPFSLGPNVVPFSAKNKTLSNYYLFWIVNGLIDTKEYKRHWTSFKNNKVSVGPSKLGYAFEELVKPAITQINLLRKQNNVLTETRDILLPRLISGQINVESL